MPAKVRKLRPTKGGKIPKDAKTVKVETLRTEQACSRARVYLERHERRAFIQAMKTLKPQIEDWARYVRHTQGKDSADLAVIQAFWKSMVAKYREYRRIESYYEGRKPAFDPDVNGVKYG